MPFHIAAFDSTDYIIVFHCVRVQEQCRRRRQPSPEPFLLSTFNSHEPRRVMPNYSADASPTPNRPVDSSPGPSFAERVRSLAYPRGNSGSPKKNDAQHAFTSDQDTAFKLKIVADISNSRNHSDRIKSLRAASTEILKCSSGTVNAILEAAQDLATTTRMVDGREAGLAFLVATAAHSALDDLTKAKLFDLITKAAPDYSSSPDQAVAVARLTHHGQVGSSLQPGLFYFISELLSTCFKAANQSRVDKRSTSSRSEEEHAFANLLSLLANLVIHDFQLIDDDISNLLLTRLIAICNQTMAESDFEGAVPAIRAIIDMAKIHKDVLNPLVDTLCYTSYHREKLRNEAQICIDILLVKYEHLQVMKLLLHNLAVPPDGRKAAFPFVRTLRGALLQLGHIYSSDQDLAITIPPLDELVEAFRGAATIDHGDLSKNQTTLTLILETTASLIKSDKIVQYLLESNWTCMDKVVAQIADATRVEQKTQQKYEKIKVSSPIYQFACSKEIETSSVTDEMEQALQSICRGFSDIYPRLTLEKRTIVVQVLLFLGKLIDPEVLTIAVDYMQDNRMIFPPDENWDSHLIILADGGFNDTSKHPLYRLRALKLITEVYESVKDVPENKTVFGRICFPLVLHPEESDLALISRLTAFACKFMIDTDIETFDFYMDKIVDFAAKKGLPSSTGMQSDLFETQHNATSSHLVELFLKSLPNQPERARKTFDNLITIAANSEVLIKTRLDSLKLLARIRCDSEGGVMVGSMPDTLGLAALLLRTEDSASGRYQVSILPNRASLVEDTARPRSGLSGMASSSNRSQSNSRTRSTLGEQKAEQNAPLWIYPGPNGLPQNPPVSPSHLLMAYPPYANETSLRSEINFSMWISLVTDILDYGADWEIYSYVLVHLPSQLTNVALFAHYVPQVEKLHDLVVLQLQKNKIFEPPASTGLKKGDVALCLYHILTALIGYNGWFQPQKKTDSTVHAFLIGIGMWDRTARCCIHALALCCHELPRSVDKFLSLILTKMSQIISQSHLAMDVLEFLVRLARLPDAYKSIEENQLRTIFGICIGYLHQYRGKRQIEGETTSSRTVNRLSNISGESVLPPLSELPLEVNKEVPEYVYTLAYHTITHWFLAISIEDRSKHVGWIAKNLTLKDKAWNEVFEEQSQVTLDMMHRTAYLDLGETKRPSEPASIDGKMIKKKWVIGMSIVTIETNEATGYTLITKRQASGTTFSVYQSNYANLPAHHVGASTQITRGRPDPSPRIYPNHVLLQLNSTISPMPIPTQPIVLPDDMHVKRAIGTFDRIDTVDSHKAGVIYIGPGQKEEREILANDKGSKAFEEFLGGLGTRVELQGAEFNTQGLDREFNLDGTHTHAWRDRVTEIVYHIPTMMPTDLEHDPQCTSKKRHTGNDFVNIIYNDSGEPFQFGTFASAFNLVNIVVTPEKVMVRLPSARLLEKLDEAGTSEIDSLVKRVFFRVQVMCDPSLPDISPAATTKIVQAPSLPGYVRQLAIHASVFCLIWSSRGGGEYVSNWRSRLREIRRLRERYANTATSANVGYPGMGTAADRGGARSYVDGDDWKGTHAMGGLAEEGHYLMSLDFTRWT
ncbi:MAG: hypothetical protein L6R41_007403 [Letrouitia leprolyta]|nr:MAG: hypothetical protein L6R41_007403 [Letrouitia leprolyta]